MILLPAAGKGELACWEERQVLAAYQRAGLTDVVIAKKLWASETTPRPRSAEPDQDDAYSDTQSLGRYASG